MTMFEYYFCSGCGHEFFSGKDYQNHPCFSGKNPDPKGKLAKMASPAKPSNANDSATFEATQSDADSGLPPVGALDLRMDAKKELIEMKKVLVANGVSAQTLNEEQTKIEYDKLQAKLADSKPFTAEPAATATSTKKTRRKSTQEE